MQQGKQYLRQWQDMLVKNLCAINMQVGSREQSAEKIIKTLRELPNKEALALRSEVAVQVGCCVLPVHSV